MCDPACGERICNKIPQASKLRACSNMEICVSRIRLVFSTVTLLDICADMSKNH
jgi:hypothetical protein